MIFDELSPRSYLLLRSADGIDGGGTPDVATPSEPEASGAGLDDALSAAFDQLSTAPAEEGGLVRDPATGRFAPKAADAQATPDGQQQEQAETGQAQPGAVPPSWSKRADLFAQAPPELQAAIVEREAEMARGVERFKGLAEFADMAEQSGTTLQNALRSYVNIEQLLHQDFVGGIKEICRNIGIEPAALAAQLGGAPAAAGAPAQSGSQPAASADQKAADPELIELRQTVHSMRLEQAGREVQNFMTDPANKYFEDVADDVARLIRASRATGDNLSLKDAYEQAIWANPTVRAKLLAEQKAEEAKAQIATATKVATTAQRAGKSLAGSSAGSQPGARGPVSLEQQLAKAYDDLSA